MLVDNRPLVSAGDQMSQLKPINKWPWLLATDRFYAMSQAVIPKASPDSIYLGGELIVGGILESIAINYNKIISGIPNYIPSPSNLRFMVKKYHEATFMSIAGFVWNYPFIMLYNKGECDGIGLLAKERYFRDGEWFQ